MTHVARACQLQFPACESQWFISHSIKCFVCFYVQSCACLMYWTKLDRVKQNLFVNVEIRICPLFLTDINIQIAELNSFPVRWNLSPHSVCLSSTKVAIHFTSHKWLLKQYLLSPWPCTASWNKLAACSATTPPSCTAIWRLCRLCATPTMLKGLLPSCNGCTLPLLTWLQPYLLVQPSDHVLENYGSSSIESSDRWPIRVQFIHLLKCRMLSAECSCVQTHSCS